MKIIFKILKIPYFSGKLPGRLTIAHQVEPITSEENIEILTFLKTIIFQCLVPPPPASLPVLGPVRPRVSRPLTSQYS